MKNPDEDTQSVQNFHTVVEEQKLDNPMDSAEKSKISEDDEENEDPMSIFNNPNPVKIVDPSLAQSQQLKDDDEGTEITIKKRRRKKRKKKVILEDDDVLQEDIGDEISRIADPISSIPKPPQKSPSMQNLELEDSKKPAEEDYEGGEDDKNETEDDNKIKPFDYTPQEDSLNDTLNPTLFEESKKQNIFDDTLKIKKRKKKIMRKKKKKVNSTMNDSNAPIVSDNIFLQPQPLQADMKDEIKSTAHEADEDEEDKTELPYDIVDDTQNTHHFKFGFGKTSLKQGYRITNLIHSYDDTVTRVWRVLILYNQVFWIFFITGIWLYGSGHTTEVNGISGYGAFGVTLLFVGLERIIHIVIVMILAKFVKRRPKTVKKHDTEEDELDDIGVRNFEAPSIPDFNATGAGFNKGNQDPFTEEEEVPESSDLKKQKSTEKGNEGFMLLIGITVVFMLFFWIWIFMMSLNYSTRAGFLWAISFGWHIIITFMFVEPFYVFVISILVFKKGWKMEELI